MQKKADLHVHTNFSDGTFSPQQVVEYASKAGLSCIAICDHDVTDGIAPAIEAGEKLGVEIVPGIELTAEKQGNEIHILGFFIDYKDPQLQEKLRKLCEHRLDRIREMVAKLKTNGVNLEAEEVFKLGGAGSIGRLHLARVIHAKGYSSTVNDAFKKYIGDGKPCYVGKINFTPEEAIAEIVKSRGIPVLAHPGIMNRDQFIPVYIKHGLRGIEVYHTDHSPGKVSRYEKIARDNDLLMTGGSDCHGMGKGRVLMGSITVPYELVEKLKNARR